MTIVLAPRPHVLQRLSQEKSKRAAEGEQTGDGDEHQPDRKPGAEEEADSADG